jgi:hypothetical protein
MTVALVTTNPAAVVAVFASVPNPMTLPNGDRVSAAAAGWTSQDSAYSLIDVTPFVTPDGQENIGAPSYTVVDGAVIETYATQPIPAPSLYQVFAAALASGISVTSTSTPTLNGTYGCTPSDQANITSIMTGIAAGAGVPGGGSTFYWLDASGAPHEFTAAQFLDLSKAIRDYVYALDMFGYGQGAQPSATATIP